MAGDATEWDDHMHEGYLPDDEPHLFTSSVIFHAHDMRRDDQCHACGQRRDNPIHVTKFAEPREK